MDKHHELGDAAAQIQNEACRIAFGRRILMNTFRAVVAEAIVEQGLGPRWRHCSEDYHPFDFERDDGLALEVKQSAARQSWAKDGDKPSICSFDIAERTGRHIDQTWVEQRRRWADVYVFAHHPLTDASADQRDPKQWMFYVALSRDLPAQSKLRLSRVQQFAVPATFMDLAKVVENACQHLEQ